MAVSSQFNLLLGNGFDADDFAKHQLGQSAEGDQNAEYVYCQFAGTVANGTVVHINSAFLATAITTASSPHGASVGVCRGAGVVNQYGWVQRRGQAPIDVAASAVANARLNTTATGGRIDDDGTTGAKVIERTVLNTTNGGSAAVVEGTLNYPTVGATL